jgi:hypothetical protein
MEEREKREEEIETDERKREEKKHGEREGSERRGVKGAKTDRQTDIGQINIEEKAE